MHSRSRASFAACNSGEETTTTQIQEPVATILEYTPAPGQFINGTMAGFDHVASEADALRYAADRLASNNWVSLGGWGGRIVAAFAEPVPNTADTTSTSKATSSTRRPNRASCGMSQDANGDGAPNVTRYELPGQRIRQRRNDPRLQDHLYPPRGGGRPGSLELTTRAAAARSTV